jgi:ElaB/YqjD/DUF883 family membrane-anchored ribosome-binding protein
MKEDIIAQYEAHVRRMGLMHQIFTLIDETGDLLSNGADPSQIELRFAEIRSTARQTLKQPRDNADRPWRPSAAEVEDLVVDLLKITERTDEVPFIGREACS